MSKKKLTAKNLKFIFNKDYIHINLALKFRSKISNIVEMEVINSEECPELKEYKLKLYKLKLYSLISGMELNSAINGLIPPSLSKKKEKEMLELVRILKAALLHDIVGSEIFVNKVHVDGLIDKFGRKIREVLSYIRSCLKKDEDEEPMKKEYFNLLLDPIREAYISYQRGLFGYYIQHFPDREEDSPDREAWQEKLKSCDVPSYVPPLALFI
jgi:hypothetical protein